MISTAPEERLKELEIPDEYKAAFIAKPGIIEYETVKTPLLKANEVLVKLAGCGLCASNIPVWEGREWFSYPMPPGVPGHEGWGIVTAMGENVSEVAPGQLVAVLNNNAFAEYVVVEQQDAVPLPEQMRNLPFPGEPFGCVMNVLKRADISEGQTVSIVGLGFIGLALIPLMKAAGAKVIALSRRDSSLQKAFELGADEVIKMDDHYRIIEEVQRLTNQQGCDRVIECTGKQWPLDLTTELAATYAKLIIAGYHQDGLRNVNIQTWNWKCLDVVNAHERDMSKYRNGIQEAADAVLQGVLDPRFFMTHAYGFADLAEGLNTLATCPDGLVKAYIKF